MLVLKDVLRPRLKPSSSGGGRVPTRQVPYRQNQIYIQVGHSYRDISKFNLYSVIHFCYKFLVCRDEQEIFCIVVANLQLYNANHLNLNMIYVF